MKKILVIAAILAAFLLAVPVMAAGSYGYIYENKYAPAPQNTGDGCGGLYVTIRAHVNDFSSTFTIQRISGNTSFTSNVVATKELVDMFKKEGNASEFNMDPDGWVYMRLAPGTYLVTLPDGNGGQPEYRIVKIDTGGIDNADFIGHAISAKADPYAVSADFVRLSMCVDSLKVVKTNEQSVPTVVSPMVDVRSALNNARSHGHHSVYFDNSPNPGGLYDAKTHVLLATISDPIYGSVKGVMINGNYVADERVPFTIPQIIFSAKYGKQGTKTVYTYGVEVGMDVDGAKMFVKNPNAPYTVTIDYAFDVHYQADKNPSNDEAYPGDFIMQTQTVTGTATLVHGSNHIDKHLDIETQSLLGDINIPTVDNFRVTNTHW